MNDRSSLWILRINAHPVLRIRQMNALPLVWIRQITARARHLWIRQMNALSPPLDPPNGQMNALACAPPPSLWIRQMIAHTALLPVY